MRLDHLLSREKMLLGTVAYFPGSGEWKAGVECCLILRVQRLSRRAAKKSKMYYARKEGFFGQYLKQQKRRALVKMGV